MRADGTLGEIFRLSDEPPQLLFGPREHPDSADGHRLTEPTQPWRLADGDSLWVIYAINKEDIELARIPLAGDAWTTMATVSAPAAVMTARLS